MILMAAVAFFWMVVLFVVWQRIISKLPIIDTFMVSLAKLLDLHYNICYQQGGCMFFYQQK